VAAGLAGLLTRLHPKFFVDTWSVPGTGHASSLLVVPIGLGLAVVVLGGTAAVVGRSLVAAVRPRVAS